MKTKNLIGSSILTLCLFFSIGCNDDGELAPDSAIVGDWDLTMIAYNDFPDGFDTNNGTLISEEELRIELFRYSFRPDETYKSISRIDGSDFVANGEFDFSKEQLETVSLENLEETHSLTPKMGSLINDDRLTMQLEIEVMALPNAVLDTLSQQLRQEQFTRYAQLVKGQLYYFFVKVN
ncbi:MAG: hypothetical protein RIF33_06930 [Cyclobacteriaceae bacterium]